MDYYTAYGQWVIWIFIFGFNVLNLLLQKPALLFRNIWAMKIEGGSCGCKVCAPALYKAYVQCMYRKLLRIICGSHGPNNCSATQILHIFDIAEHQGMRWTSYKFYAGRRISCFSCLNMALKGRGEGLSLWTTGRPRPKQASFLLVY